LIRLEKFFISNPNINIVDFFNSPYEIYGPEEYFDLKFFTSQKSISIYSLYIKKVMESDPDKILDRILSGIKFIKDFCLQNKISVIDYANHMTGLYPTFVLHLKNFTYPLYIIFYIPNAEQKFIKIPSDEKIFLFSDNVYSNINELKRKVQNSLNAHRVLEAWINKQKNNN
jgi:hypothetical protein